MVTGNAVQARAKLLLFAKPSALGTAKPATIFRNTCKRSCSRHIQHLICVVLARGWRRQRLPVSLVQLDYLFHEAAKFGEDPFLIIAMAAAVDQAGAAADEALVLIRPLNDFRVPGAVLHP